MKCRASFVKELRGSLRVATPPQKLTAQVHRGVRQRIGRAPIPANPQTEEQQAQRARYLPCVNQWLALSPEEKKSWETEDLPGYQNFMKSCLPIPEGCTNQVAAVYKPPGPTTMESLFSPWYYGQTFKVMKNGSYPDCDIIRLSWWLSSHNYVGNVYTAIRATDEIGRPTGGDLSTGSYFQPPVPDLLPPQERQFLMTEFKLLGGVKYAQIIWIDRGDPFNCMTVENIRIGASYPEGEYMFSWDFGVTWSRPPTWWDFKFEVYGCVY